MKKDLATIALTGLFLIGQGCGQKTQSTQPSQNEISALASFPDIDRGSGVSVALGDMNNDGKIDIVYSCTSQTISYRYGTRRIAKVYILYNKGDGIYTSDLNSLK